MYQNTDTQLQVHRLPEGTIPPKEKNFPSFISYPITRAGGLSPIPRAFYFSRSRSGFPDIIIGIRLKPISKQQHDTSSWFDGPTCPEKSWPCLFPQVLVLFYLLSLLSPKSTLNLSTNFSVYSPSLLLSWSVFSYSSPLQSLTNDCPHLHQAYLSPVLVSRKINKKNSQNRKSLISYLYFSFYKNPILRFNSWRVPILPDNLDFYIFFYSFFPEILVSLPDSSSRQHVHVGI